MIVFYSLFRGDVTSSNNNESAIFRRWKSNLKWQMFHRLKMLLQLEDHLWIWEKAVDPRPIPEVLHLLQVVDQIPPHPKLLAAFCYSRKPRPTSRCSLLFLVVSNILKHLDLHNILVDCQHGFRAKRSCETQLLTLSHELLSNLHSSIQTDLIILVWEKAVDPRSIPEVLHLLQVVDQIPPHPKLLAAFCYSRDLDNLATWEKMWGMQFHPEKCISLSVTRSQTPFHTSYILKGHTLETPHFFPSCQVVQVLLSSDWIFMIIDLSI
jgi:hypothetical protein